LNEELRQYFDRHKNIDNSYLSFHNAVIKRCLKEEKGRSRQRGIYKFYCMISYGISNTDERMRGLDDILADLRALQNVTIVTVVISNQKVSPGRYIAGLSVKFIPSTPGQLQSPEFCKARIVGDMKRLQNLENVFKLSAGLERIE